MSKVTHTIVAEVTEDEVEAWQSNDGPFTRAKWVQMSPQERAVAFVRDELQFNDAVVWVTTASGSWEAA